MHIRGPNEDELSGSQGHGFGQFAHNMRSLSRIHPEDLAEIVTMRTPGRIRRALDVGDVHGFARRANLRPVQYVHVMIIYIYVLVAQDFVTMLWQCQCA